MRPNGVVFALNREQSPRLLRSQPIMIVVVEVVEIFLFQNRGLAHVAVQPLLALLFQIFFAHPIFRVLVAHLLAVAMARWVTFESLGPFVLLHIHFHIHFRKAREVRVTVREHVALSCNCSVSDVPRENGQMRGEVWLLRSRVQRGPELMVHNVLLEELPFGLCELEHFLGLLEVQWSRDYQVIEGAILQLAVDLVTHADAAIRIWERW
mmetsp:Transcript_64438/g.170672  ORF Transcript_64438/g.170672 Transcript_64438/m.170672 type:complete len:209 (-) Transcript_64438:1459-2085(-)